MATNKKRKREEKRNDLVGPIQLRLDNLDDSAVLIGRITPTLFISFFFVFPFLSIISFHKIASRAPDSLISFHDFNISLVSGFSNSL